MAKRKASTAGATSHSPNKKVKVVKLAHARIVKKRATSSSTLARAPVSTITATEKKASKERVQALVRRAYELSFGEHGAVKLTRD
jgi:hypothetical protein